MGANGDKVTIGGITALFQSLQLLPRKENAMFANASTFAQYSSLPIASFWHNMNKMLENQAKVSDQVYCAFQQMRHRESSTIISSSRIDEMDGHVRVRRIKKTSLVQIYDGLYPSADRSRKTARLFEDWNEIHMTRPGKIFEGTPNAGKLIAHGADQKTQALFGLHLSLRGTELFTASASTTFVSPVFQDETEFEIHIFLTSDPFKRLIKIVRKCDKEGRPIQVIEAELRPGKTSRREKIYRLLACGVNSGRLADTWNGCTYCKQDAHFGSGDITPVIHTSVRGIGFDEKKRLRVETKIVNENHEAIMTGHALIYPAGIKPPKKVN